MLTLLSLAMALGLAALCAAVPFGVHALPTSAIIGITCGCMALAILGGTLAVGPYPWTDVLVLTLALSAGLWLGRGLAPKPGAFVIVLIVLSALDILQIALSGPASHSASTTIPPAAALYGNFFLLLPWGHFNIGIFDLFLIAALAEVWRTRGDSYLLALLPGVLGLVLGYGFLIFYQGAIPLIPFLTLGWFASVGLRHVLHISSQSAHTQSSQ